MSERALSPPLEEHRWGMVVTLCVVVSSGTPMTTPVVICKAQLGQNIVSHE